MHFRPDPVSNRRNLGLPLGSQKKSPGNSWALQFNELSESLKHHAQANLRAPGVRTIRETLALVADAQP